MTVECRFSTSGKVRSIAELIPNLVSGAGTIVGMRYSRLPRQEDVERVTRMRG
jgi:hypothetical protein